MRQRLKDNTKSKIADKAATPDKHHIYVILLVCLFVFFLYVRVFSNELTNWDDDSYILDNPFIRSFKLNNLGAIFSHFYMGNYHPLSMLCYNLGYALGGTNPWPYQLINILLHSANTALVFIFITKLLSTSNSQGKYSGFIAVVTTLLFAVNTLQVESVAWVSENKNVLYSFFFLSSLTVYVNYLQKHKPGQYLGSLSLFILALFSKGMAVTLSLTLFAVDFLAGRKLLSRPVILEKIPFFVLSLVFGIIALKAQGTAINYSVSGEDLNIVSRAALAVFSFFRYMLKMLVPVNLSALYGYPLAMDEFLGPVYFISGALLILSVILLLKAKPKKEYLFGMLFYAFNILPLLQLIPVGEAIMADRYSYVPSIGFFFAFVCILSDQAGEFQTRRRLLTWIFLLYVIVLSALTYARIGIWRDSRVLWSDVLKKTENTQNSKAWFGRGSYYYQKAEFSLAIEDFTRAILVNPGNADAYFNRGMIYLNNGSPEKAMDDLNRSIQLNEDLLEAYNARAYLRGIRNDYKGALQDLDRSVQLDPNNADVYITRGYLKDNMGNISEALADYDRAIKHNPDNLLSYKVRIRARLKMKDYQGVIDDCNRLLLSGREASVLYDRGYAAMKMNQHSKGCPDILEAIKLGYSTPDSSMLVYCGFNSK